MKQKYEGKDLQGLVDLGREQGYLTFDQVNDFLPQDVASPTDLRAALESFEDMDIKVLEEVPTEGAEGEIDAEPEKEAEEETADAAGDSSDPVRLYLKEMGNFQLLSREQEVEIAKRIEAGEQEVEEEVLKSPVTLDFLIDLGERIEAVQLCCADQGQSDSPMLGGAVGTLNKAFFRATATPFMPRSTTLVSISSRPSSRKRRRGTSCRTA